MTTLFETAMKTLRASVGHTWARIAIPPNCVGHIGRSNFGVSALSRLRRLTCALRSTRPRPEHRSSPAPAAREPLTPHYECRRGQAQLLDERGDRFGHLVRFCVAG